MKILLFGKTGQVGTQFQRHASSLASLQPVDRTACDLTDPIAVREYVLRAKPDCVVNAAAYTAVDKAESDQTTCSAVNAAAPGAMAEAARELGIPLLHYSTDYVFNGQKSGPYVEEDPTDPLGVYGLSKLEGEQRIAAAGGRFIVLRNRWVYGAEGQNFLRTMLRLGAQRPELRIVSDQVGAPTSSSAIAAATFRIIQEKVLESSPFPSGVYHMTASGAASWFEFAARIFLLAKMERKPDLLAIPSDEYPTPAKRPKNSMLSNDKFARAFGFRLDPWETLLEHEMLQLQKTAVLS